jgi:hypothetical protein
MCTLCNTHYALGALPLGVLQQNEEILKGKTTCILCIIYTKNQSDDNRREGNWHSNGSAWYFYRLNTCSPILLQKKVFMPVYVTTFYSCIWINRLRKQNIEMLLQDAKKLRKGSEISFFIEVSRCGYLDH